MFEHLCKEKTGHVWRAVWVVRPSVQWAMGVVEELQKVENFLPKDNPFEMLLNPANKFFQVDSVGMIAVVPAPDWPQLLHVHITFWDGRLRGREGLCRSLASWVCSFTGKVLYTQVPEDRKALLAFARRAGFQSEAKVGSSDILIFTNYAE